MSVKKNLTIASIAALLAVPTFSIIGTGNNLHVLSPTVHADSLYDYWHTPTGQLYHGLTLGGHYYPSGTKLYNSNYASGPYSAAMGPSPYAPRYDIPAWARTSGNDIQNSNTSDDSSDDGTNNNSNTINGSSQYASKNSLPQTGEINNQAKRIAASIILGATSIGTGVTALTLKKHYHSGVKANTYYKSVASGNDNRISNIINELRTETSQLQNITNRIVND